ncbi:MAG: hypothetical protein HQM10_19710 [Candidatus Riflebacteria bacterium]|nr:hypothetical protein [Candidatus Riflebacteria bacterium]
MKRKQALPKGMTEKDVLQLIEHFENQTDDEAIAEDEAAFGEDRCTVMEVPTRLVDKVRAMIAREIKAKRTKTA